MVVLGWVRAFSSDYLTTPPALREAGENERRGSGEWRVASGERTVELGSGRGHPLSGTRETWHSTWPGTATDSWTPWPNTLGYRARHLASTAVARWGRRAAPPAVTPPGGGHPRGCPPGSRP